MKKNIFLLKLIKMDQTVMKILAILAVIALVSIIIGSRKEGFAVFASSAVTTGKNNLVASVTDNLNASANQYNVYTLKPNTDLAPVITTTKGWNAAGVQNVDCIASNIFPKNVYDIVNANAVCSIAPDANGVTDSAAFSARDAQGRRYLAKENILASTLRSGSGISCNQQYANAYGANLRLDTTLNQYYKMASDPVCLTTPDTTYYTGPVATAVGTITTGSTYI